MTEGRVFVREKMADSPMGGHDGGSLQNRTELTSESLQSCSSRNYIYYNDQISRIYGRSYEKT